MATHEWDTWAAQHGQPTRREQYERMEPTYYCRAEACIVGGTAMTGDAMAEHLEVVHHVQFPMTPRQGAVRLLDGPRFHATETEWYYGKTLIVKRQRTG